MMGGLMVATVLTIFFLPALYAVWFGVGKEDKGVVNAVERPLRPLDCTADRRRRSASVGMRLQSRG